MNPKPTWWQRPEAYLYAWDFAAGNARFLTLDRTALERSSFLDQRIRADLSTLRTVPIADLLGESPPRPDIAPAFIFHTAFCCSTLLARSFDLPGHTLVLSEPSTLLQLADLKRGLTAADYSPAPLLESTLALLSRPFIPGERVLIKPTNLATNLGPDILALYPGARALVLYDDLEAFLLSILKRPRESENGISQFLARFLADPAGRRWAAGRSLPETLPERAALAWHLQIQSLGDWLGTEHAERIRLLRTPRLLAAPTATLAAVAAWLELDLGTEACRSVIEGPLWRRHIKHPEINYTPDRRVAEQDMARRIAAEPLARGLAYARRHLGRETAVFPNSGRRLP